MSVAELTFFGVRGSYPVADRRMAGVGGNTTSLLYEAAGQTVVFDAGTGIIALGRLLMRRRPPPRRISLFLTHLHIDHIVGLPFFAPLFAPNCRIDVYGPACPGVDLAGSVYRLFESPYSPITRAGIRASLSFRELAADEAPGAVALAPRLQVRHLYHGSHPLLGVMVYQPVFGRGRLVFATDIESPDGFSARMLAFVRGTDVLIHDSQYLERDYRHARLPKQGYGHSTVAMAARNAAAAAVGRLFLFHFDPEYSDATLALMRRQAQPLFRRTDLARERKRIRIRS